MLRAAAALLAVAALAAGRPAFAAEEARARSARSQPEATTPAHRCGQARPTPEEKAEKEARKACKKKICDILATRDPAGDDVACDIVKTWREEDITKMLGGKIDWPWGKAVCQSKLELKRDAARQGHERADL